MRQALHLAVAALLLNGGILRAQPGGAGGSGGGPGGGGSSDGSGRLGGATFQVDLDARRLIVTTDPETNEAIRKIIEEVDRPIPQALIKVLFLEVKHTDDLDVGIDMKLEHTESDGDFRLMETMLGAASFTEGGMVSVLEGDLQVTLSALAKVTEMEVLSRPSIMARSNEEATITIGNEVPLIRNSQVTDDGRVLNTVEYEDVGIILTVTPYITGKGTVELDVAPEISTLTGETVQISDTVSAPTIAKRSAETRVVVPEGRTVVIGGLMENQETTSERKVPLLGDIPALGRLFRRSITDKEKTELLIFLTPHVVRTGEEARNLTEAEGHATIITPESVDADTLRRYLPDGTVPSAKPAAGKGEPTAPSPE